MSRIEKLHWCKWRDKKGVWEFSYSLCGKTNPTYANAKRKVTCKNCQRVMGLHNKSTGEQK